MSASEVLALASAPRIDDVTLEGPGCGATDPAAIRVSGARDTFRIDFEDFVVSARSAPERRSTECTVSVVLQGEAGVAYAPAGLDLELNTSAVSTVSTMGYWTSTPGVKSEDVTTSRSRGRYVTGALDDQTLWSSCSGSREFRFTVKLGLGERAGRAELERLSDLHFYARKCEGTSPEHGDAATPDASASSIDAGVVDPPTSVDADARVRDAALPSGPDDAASTPIDGSSQAVSISSLRARGTGCPASSTVVRIPEGRDTFDIDFSGFTSEAATERGLPLLYCIVVADIVVPEGKTVALERFTARGSASLPAGAAARVFATHDFVGAPEAGPMGAIALTGPHEGGFELSAGFGESELLFRPCGQARSLSLNLSLSTEEAQTGSPLRARIDSIGGFRFRVRDCE